MSDAIKSIKEKIKRVPDENLQTQLTKKLENKIIEITAVAVPEVFEETNDHSEIAIKAKDMYFKCQRFKHGSLYVYRPDRGYWDQMDKSYFKATIYDLCKKMFSKPLTSQIVNSVFSLTEHELLADDHLFISQDPRVIVFSNCEVRMGEDFNWSRHEHAAENYRISGIQAMYDENAECPRFLKYMDETFDNMENSETLKLRMMELMGMTLISSNMDSQILFLDGEGRNGKGVMQKLMENILGKDARTIISPKHLKEPVYLARTYGKLMILCGDVAIGEFLADDMVKQISGGDTVSGKKLYSQPFDFEPTATIWMAGNHGVKTKDTSPAMIARMNIIPFQNTRSEEDQDQDLIGKLIAEIPGITNVILKAYSDKCKRGKFTVSEDMENAKKKWLISNSIFQEYALENVSYKKGAVIYHKDLYKHFKEWCDLSGIKKPPISKKCREELSGVLKAMGITIHNRSGGAQKWEDIALKSLEIDPADLKLEEEMKEVYEFEVDDFEVVVGYEHAVEPKEVDAKINEDDDWTF